ncbi:MAG: hypothetical protein KDF65_05195, partial [Anaerolineae bacterium]|nr:hypothetical protein [Anaerolineae bacterium]
TGHGPQGDAIRIDNYVRLVRGGQVSLTPAGDPSASPARQINQAVPDGQAGPPAGPQNGPPNGAPPPEALEACTGQSQGSTCQFTAPRGQVIGTCALVQQHLACVPVGGPPN